MTLDHYFSTDCLVLEASERSGGVLYVDSEVSSLMIRQLPAYASLNASFGSFISIELTLKTGMAQIGALLELQVSEG